MLMTLHLTILSITVKHAQLVGDTKIKRSKQGVSKIPVGRNAHWHITEFDEFGDPLSPPTTLTNTRLSSGYL